MATSEATQYILQAFNALDERVALAPEHIIDTLMDWRSKAIDPSLINIQTQEQDFDSDISESNSYDSTQQHFAASVGLSGKYGFYSASVKASFETSSSLTTTNYNFGFRAVVDRGTVGFNRATDVDTIRQYLLPALCQRLDAIATSADAAAFTAQYGTHIVTALSLGGMIYTSITADTEQSSSYTQMSLEVSAAYNGVSSIEATASVTQSLATNYSASQFAASVTAIGGDAGDAGNINPSAPDSYTNWMASCGTDTVRGIFSSLEFWQLAANSTAAGQLKNYLGLTMLAQSISNPTIFSLGVPTNPTQFNTARLVPGDGFKLIGGGAKVTDLSSWLNGCHPEPTGDPSAPLSTGIVAWTATCHDLDTEADPGNMLTVYGFAVYDPDDLMSVAVAQLSQAPAAGRMDLGALCPSGTLSGGGVQTDLVPGQGKSLMASYPQGPTSDLPRGYWGGVFTDYERPVVAGGASYCVGIGAAGLSINATITEQSGDATSHGNTSISVSGCIGGGGAGVIDLPGGMGNFLRSSFPSRRDTWTEVNADLDGNVSPAVPLAYAIKLTATLI